MKTLVHKSDTRGFANHEWLKTSHSFSFANFLNPERMQFGALRVLNDDWIQAGKGFGNHPHKHMEIITIVLEGVIKHRDSMSNAWQELKVNDVQVMSAGTGLQHSEMNGSKSDGTELLQIWIIPNSLDLEPRYDQKMFNPTDRDNRLQTLVSSFSDTDDRSLKIHQDARISRIDLDAHKEMSYTLKSEAHGVYLFLISGKIQLNHTVLEARDAIGISETKTFQLSVLEDSQVLFIEVPMK